MPGLQETAAIILEPILGEGGFLTPPPGFLSALRALCDKHGMLLIFDEVGARVGHSVLAAVKGCCWQRGLRC